MKTTTQKLVLSAMFAAIICVVTYLIKLPAPKGGYFNIGDAVLLLSGFMLPPIYGFFAAALGSSLADVFSGFIIYAPVTFLLKGIMALIVSCGFRQTKKDGSVLKTVLCALAEIIMVLGYYIFEGFLYGFVPSLANIPVNAAQGTICLVLGLFLIKVFEKAKKII